MDDNSFRYYNVIAFNIIKNKINIPNGGDTDINPLILSANYIKHIQNRGPLPTISLRQSEILNSLVNKYKNLTLSQIELHILLSQISQIIVERNQERLVSYFLGFENLGRLYDIYLTFKQSPTNALALTNKINEYFNNPTNDDASLPSRLYSAKLISLGTYYMNFDEFEILIDGINKALVKKNIIIRNGEPMLTRIPTQLLDKLNQLPAECLEGIIVLYSCNKFVTKNKIPDLKQIIIDVSTGKRE